MRSDDIIKALDIGKKWTAQIKKEEKSSNARRNRASMWAPRRTSLREICFDHMEEAWRKASGGGLPTHWRQMFYVMRPICDDHPRSDRKLLSPNFKNILEDYLEECRPGWDVLRGARGVFKEPHRAENDNGLAMSTMNVRNYLRAGEPDTKIPRISWRFPTNGVTNRIAAVLICEKEGFDELLMAEHVPERFDLALMSTKGISAFAARDLAVSATRAGAPCFTLHDFDKNGFVMTGGFRHATDLGLRLEDVEKWGLDPEPQLDDSPGTTFGTLLRNGATEQEAEFISAGERVELNMFTSDDFIRFVEGKLREHGVEKVVPDDETLRVAWERAHVALKVNKVIASTWSGEREQPPSNPTSDNPPMPDDLTDRIRDKFEDDDTLAWDEALWGLAEDAANGDL